MTKAYLEIDDVKRLERAATCLRDRLLIRILFHLGCRISEALALRVEDIDFDAGIVTILHLKSRVNTYCPRCGARLGKTHMFCPGCGGKVDKAAMREEVRRRTRTLPVDSDTLETLSDFIRRDRTIGPIFRINRHRAWQIVSECAEKAGLPKLVNAETGKVHNVSPHRLRDAFAVHAVKLDDSGDGLRLLQEHLGHQHQSFNTTAKYRKVAGEEHRRWYQRLWEKEKL
jgi:integrase/recombinase XerD